METILLCPVWHRKAEQILVICPDVPYLSNAIKKMPGVKWSHTHKAWYMPLNKESYHSIQQALRQIALINNEALKKYLLKKKR